MIRAESLHCPNCTAPLHLQNKQALVACLYCNSTIRITYQDMAQPAAATRPDVSPEVVDEVKRLLVLGQRLKAVDYYAQQAQVSEGDAAAVITTIQQSLGYAPPLNNMGLLMLIGYECIALLAIGAGGVLLLSGQLWLGAGLILLALFFAIVIALGLGRGLPGYLLLQRGEPALAVITKIWPIRSFPVRGRNPSLAHLQRFLLEIHLPHQPVYQAEANGIVTETSLPRFQVGSRLSIKVSPTNPNHIVIIGPKE
jgi:hypothetical protein